MTNNEFDFCDWGSWGLYEQRDCLYDNGELLEKYLKSGKDFDTEWHGFKKELESMRISAKGNNVIVEVSAYCDDMPYDLTYDAVWAVYHDENMELTEDEIEEINDMYCDDMWLNTEYNDSTTLPRSATLEDILKAASELRNNCVEQLDNTFKAVKGFVKFVVDNRNKGE